MSITTDSKQKLENEKINLEEQIAVLKKSMKIFKAERKSAWNSFKAQFKTDLAKIKKIIKYNGKHKK
jgi:hypothetical protein